MRETIKRLSARGHQVEILAPAWRGLASHEVDGVPVHRFRYAPAQLEILTGEEGAPARIARRPWLQLLAAPYIVWGALACLRHARRLRADVLHVHWPFPHGLMALPARLILGIPLLPNFHGAELLMSERKRWVRPLLRLVLRYSPLAVANSSFTAGRVATLGSLPVRVIPYGTAQGAGHAGTRRPAPDGRFRALFVGRHIERKGIEHLIEAFALLPSDRFELVIAGEGDQTESLRARAQTVPGGHIRFAGRLATERLREEYGAAHAFVLPAVVDARGDTEGLGVVLVEAAEYGLPLVASAVGGIVDVVEDGVTGLAVPPADPRALANALRALADDPALATRLAEGARARVRALFDWDGIIDRLERTYEDVSRNDGDRAALPHSPASPERRAREAS